MKFTSSSLSLVLFLSAVSTVSSFAPNTVHTTRIGTSATSFNDHIITADTRTSTELGLFGSRWRQARKFNAPAKTIGKGSSITEEEVRSLFTLWNSALATGDSRIVASRYTKNPVLLPTVSDQARTDYDSVKDYFDAFLLKKPQGKIIEGKINIGDSWASDCGIYEFTLGATGEKVKARYSFNYVQENGVWKIQHHHSSVMPEEIAMGKAITEDEVRGLFSLWNNALATLDPKQVAARYAKKGVLLPTVSDKARTDFSSIEDYFVNFLKLKPRGTILESHVTVGKNWCQDAGIYEFEMRATGKTVKGRYSFIYVYEDGEWKINHHHSSIMPEGIVTAEPITKEEVRGLFNLWNDALATKDPIQVAKRYSKDGVLLPTVSDDVRTDFPGIVDYFTNFLKLEPQGEILGGKVTIGTNWAQGKHVSSGALLR
eukprot:scaffold2518_cov272-Alexandrium_tamarense.AAC.4